MPIKIWKSFRKSSHPTQGQQIKFVKWILAMFLNTKHTWLDKAYQIDLLRSIWSNKLERISGSKNDEQIIKSNQEAAFKILSKLGQ